MCIRDRARAVTMRSAATVSQPTWTSASQASANTSARISATWALRSLHGVSQPSATRASSELGGCAWPRRVAAAKIHPWRGDEANLVATTSLRTARRAVLNEVVATRFASSPRHGWILAAATRRGQAHPPSSLEALLAEGWETPCNDLNAHVALILADVFAEACEALVGVGWDAVAAERIVTALADLEPPRDPRSVAVGWRSLATALDLPPWQASRARLCRRPSGPGV